jgi:hypothetical protein
VADGLTRGNYEKTSEAESVTKEGQKKKTLQQV